MWFQLEIEERVEGRIRSFSAKDSTCGCFGFVGGGGGGIRRHSYFARAQNTGIYSVFAFLYNILHKDVEQENLSQASMPFGPRVFCRFGKVLGTGYGAKRAKTFRVWYILAQYVVLRGENAAKNQCFGHKMLSIYLSIDQST